MKFKLKNKQDLKAEQITGVRFIFEDGVWFQSLRAGGSNGKYTAAIAVMQQRLMREFGSRPVPKDRLRLEQATLYANTCLIDWGVTVKVTDDDGTSRDTFPSGIPGEDGVAVPFSSAAALQLLIDPENDTYYTEYDNRVADARHFLVDDAGGASAEQVGSDLGKS